LELIRRYLDTIPFKRIVTHRYKIEKAKDAMLKSMELESMKVVIVP